MSSFYGNIVSHLPRSGFTFTKVFPNRKSLEEYDWNDDEKNQALGVGAYVLVDYNTGDGYAANETVDNIYIPENLSSANYHRTVWQVRKDEIQNQYVCSFELIAKINSTLISNFVPIGSYFTIHDMEYWDYGTFGSVSIAWPDEDTDVDWTTTVIDLTFKNPLS